MEVIDSEREFVSKETEAYKRVDDEEAAERLMQILEGIAHLLFESIIKNLIAIFTILETGVICECKAILVNSHPSSCFNP